jgi:microcystin-dependent protein
LGEYFIGEIRLFAFGITPNGWLPCDGRVLNIQTNATLYSLLGSQFGGDGKTTFALPDLRGRAIVGAGISAHGGSTYTAGKAGGVEGVALTSAQMVQHFHTVTASAANASAAAAKGNFFANAVPTTGSGTELLYNAASTGLQPLAPGVIGSTGGSAAHDNMQPSLVLNYCISTTGVYPSRP